MLFLWKIFKRSFVALSKPMLPSFCPVCFTDVSIERGVGFCPECYAKLPFWDKSYVPKPSFYVDDMVEDFDAPFLYKDDLPKLVHQFKYGDKLELASALGVFMSSVIEAYIAGQNAEKMSFVLLPVPMHKRRLWLRQYNQSAVLAKEISKYLNIPLNLKALQRKKHTSPQRGKTKKQRMTNLSGAFHVDAHFLKHKKVILIDDVWTTGATAKQCARLLKKKGVDSVFVCTLCYVDNGYC